MLSVYIDNILVRSDEDYLCLTDKQALLGGHTKTPFLCQLASLINYPAHRFLLLPSLNGPRVGCMYRVCTVMEKLRKSWNCTIKFSRPGKSWNSSVSHGKLCSWYKVTKAAYVVGIIK